MLVVLATAMLGFSRLRRSDFGLLLKAAKGNERRVQAVGFDPVRYRLAAYVAAGMLCGLAGFLDANFTSFVTPAAMSWTASGELIFIVIVGGVATISGPLVGAPRLPSDRGVDGRAHGLLALLVRPVPDRHRPFRPQRPRRPPDRTTRMTHALEVRDLNKYFGGLHATRNVSMALPRGEMHAVIGPNGAGKTTLIAQLFGEVSPTSGTVLVNGRDVTHRPVHERAGLGMARSFQITTLVRDVTVGENVCLALLARRERAFRFWRRIDRNADLQDEAARALARIGMGREHMPRRVADMSHGEQRLLELAVALVGDPTLILLDEPMAGLARRKAAR